MNTGFEQKAVFFVPASLLEFDADLPRNFFKEDKVKDISASIKEKGILQPLMVRPKNDGSGKYKVVMGKMRLTGALEAKCAKIPCFIENVDDKEALELALVENIQREDLSPFEEGWGILRLVKNFGYSIEQVCQKLGKNDNFIRDRLKLLSLPEEIQKHVVHGKLGFENARYLVELNPKEQLEMAKEIIKLSLTRDQARSLVLGKTRKVGKIYQPKAKIDPKRIYIQSKILTSLLDRTDFSGYSYVEKESLKSALKKLTEKLGKDIKKLDDLLLLDD